MEVQLLKEKIHVIRSIRIILDLDLAEFYGVKTRVLKQAVRRNIDCFLYDFMFELTKNEFNNLRSQIATSSSYGGRRYKPFAFTEQVKNVYTYHS